MLSAEKVIDLCIVLEEIAPDWMLDRIEAADKSTLRIVLLVTMYQRGIGTDGPEWRQISLRDYGCDVCSMLAELCGPLTKETDLAIYRAINAHIDAIELSESDFLPGKEDDQ